MDGETATETRKIPIQGDWRICLSILILHSKLPAKQRSHENGEESPSELRKLRPAEDLEIKEPTPEDVCKRSSDTGAERCESSGTDGEVPDKVDAEVGAVPVESDENGDEEVELLSLNEGEPLLELFLNAFVCRRVRKSRAIRADYFFRGRDEESKRKTQALEGDQNEICAVSNTSSLSCFGVEGELD